MSNFSEFLKDNIVILDGGMGTILQERGLLPGEHPELWNITHPDVITDIHKSYFDAGSNVVSANTFGANILKFPESELENIIKAAMKNANEARAKSLSHEPKFVAIDIGPTGKLLKPLGDLDFEDAVEIFAKTVRLGVKHGAELIIIETMNDSYETKAALLAAKENSELPVIVTNAYGEDGKLMTGATPGAMAAMLEGLGADAIGANCSLGPDKLRPVIEELLRVCSVPVVLKPNAGLPRVEAGKTVFDVDAEAFSHSVCDLVDEGVRLVGGCCGTTPEYIKSLKSAVSEKAAAKITDKNLTVVSSYTHAVTFGASAVLIGERINPTGKKRFKEALKCGDMDYILSEAANQQERGAHILDVNVGLPDIDEREMLKLAVTEIQSISDLPLQIDTSDADAMAAALRCYNGKPMINSVNGKEESMRKIFPLAKKYGGVIVALTLDESGIPKTAEGRVEIARKILHRAEEYGISKKDIIFDTLAMTVSADPKAAIATLKALSSIKNKLGCHTSLGVSNVSFGLPARDAINSTFFAMALNNGLSAAIMNPYSSEMMKTYYSYLALAGLDENFAEYIKNIPTLSNTQTPMQQAPVSSEEIGDSEPDALRRAIIKGFKERAAELTEEYLKRREPIEIVEKEIIPALNTVGEGFERKTVYLPGLLMSAEAAKAAFEVIKGYMSARGSSASSKGNFVIATVKGDIHDIGKNIVKLILENYGFNVIDLGKDTPPELIVEAVLKYKAPLVGLSALMTTTVPAMSEAVQLLRKNAPFAKIIVGGAVLNEEYAAKIGADKYAKDAMEAVRCAEALLK